MENGTIIARVYTSEATIPVIGASVTVYSVNENNQREIDGVRTTDANGLTDAITINTPNKTESENPNNNQTAPFAICNIKVDHQRFESVLIKNVQIFSGVQTLQNVVMIPLRENSSVQENVQEFDITPQNL